MSTSVSHDSAWIVSGSKDRSVQFWDSKSGIAHCMLQGHKNSGEFSTFYYHHHHHRFSMELLTFPSPIPVIATDLSPAGNLLATGSGDWQARICTFSIDFIFTIFHELKFRSFSFLFFSSLGCCRELYHHLNLLEPFL